MTLEPPTTDDWVVLTDQLLDVGLAADWVALPGCGAVVVFSGLVRDYADGSSGVTHIDYEAWAEQVEPRLGAIAEQARQRWPELGRIAIWHREGRVLLSESSVVVAVSAPHRGAAFDACEFAIDTLKESVPIWKKEFFDGGSHITDTDDRGVLA